MNEINLNKRHGRQVGFRFVTIVMLLLALLSLGGPLVLAQEATPTVTETLASPTDTPTATDTDTPTATPTATATATSTPVPTATDMATALPTDTATVTETPTSTATGTTTATSTVISAEGQQQTAEPNQGGPSAESVPAASIVDLAELPQAPVSPEALQAFATYRPGLDMTDEEFASLKAQAALAPADPSAQLDPALVADAPSSLAPIGPQQSFDGPNQSGVGGWYPPDPILAAGPSHVVTCVNSSIYIYSKTGSLLFSSTWASFFSPVTSETFLFDPKCIYDVLGGRFILVVLERNTSTQVSSYLLAVSQNSSAIGSWWVWKLNARLDGSNNSTNWADYPGLGVDSSAIYITSNQFSFSGSVFQYAKVRILDKSAVYAGGSVSWYDFWNWSNPGYSSKAFTWQPAQHLTNAYTGYMVNSWSGSGSMIFLWTITNPLAWHQGTGTPNLSGVSLGTAAYSLPPDADQPNTTVKIATNDARLMNVVVWGGTRLWTAHAIANDGRAALRLYEIYTAGPTITYQATFYSQQTHYFFPAVMMDGSANMGVVFSQSGSSVYATMRYTGKRATSGLEGSNFVVAGQGTHTTGRWGDYGGAAIDPNGSTFWFFHEYAGSGGIWKTRVFSARYRQRTPVDFDGDGKTDPTFVIPNALLWRKSTDGQWDSIGFGGSPAVLVGNDFDGDGKMDPTFVIPNALLWRKTIDGQWDSIGFGGSPTVLSGNDFDGDGKTDPTFVIPNALLWRKSTDGQWDSIGFGGSPTVLSGNDFDGDGKTDPTFVIPNALLWRKSTDGQWDSIGFGGSPTVLSRNDFDGDGKTDPTFVIPNALLWRKTTDGQWDSIGFGGSPTVLSDSIP